MTKPDFKEDWNFSWNFGSILHHPTLALTNSICLHRSGFRLLMNKGSNAGSTDFVRALQTILNIDISVVCKVRTESVLHVLEPLFIKSLKPDLCKQMEFFKCLHLFSNTWALTHLTHLYYGCCPHAWICRLDLAPSLCTVLYISSQFVQIEYYFWWVATDEPERNRLWLIFPAWSSFLQS